MFAEKVVKPESEVTPCSDAGRFLYMRPVFAKSLAKPVFFVKDCFYLKGKEREAIRGHVSSGANLITVHCSDGNALMD